MNAAGWLAGGRVPRRRGGAVPVGVRCPRWLTVLGVVLAVVFLPSTAWAETTPPAPVETTASATTSPTTGTTTSPEPTATETVTATTSVTQTVTATPTGPVEVAPVTLDASQFGAVGVVLCLLLAVCSASFAVGLRR